MTPVEKHYRENRDRLVKKFTRTFGKAEAEDIIQDTYLKILEANNDNIVEFDNYFSTSLHSVITDHYRDIKMKGMVVELKESLPSSATPERDIIEKEMSSELTDRIFDRTRHPLHYKVLFLSLVAEESIKTIANETRLSKNNIRKIVSRFRKENRSYTLKDMMSWKKNKSRAFVHLI